MFKKFAPISLIMVLVLSAALLTGCGQSQPKDESQNAEPKTKVVVDASGAEVEIPAKIDRIVITCYGGAGQEIALFGASQKVVAQPTSVGKFDQLLKMFPQFKDIPDLGLGDEANLEEIAKADPDLVIAGVFSPTGNKKIKDADIPVYSVLCSQADIETLKKEFQTMGTIFNEEQKAQKLVTYWDDTIKLISDRVTNIPPEQRKKVYLMNGSAYETEGKAKWGQELIETAGGINVAAELGSATKINDEQLMQWDPDVIISRNNANLSAAGIKKDPKFQDLKAVKNNQVYDNPMGAFWWDRPSPESPLGFLWLAKTLYPEAMHDIDLKAKTIDFYKEFYHYSLSDAEYTAFLNPGSASK